MRGVRGLNKSTNSRHERQVDYKSVFENSLDGIYRSTPDGRYIDVNPALVRILGYSSKEELLNVNIARDVYFDQSERRDAAERNSSFTTRLRRKDGSEIWVEITSWVIYGDHGEVLYYEGITRDITDRKQLEQTIWYQAYHDALTGLPNRYLFNDRLNQALANARRTGQILGVMFLDLDNFKNINDSLGHHLGDKLLQMVSLRLLKCIREGDTIARLGGDEFTLLLQLNQADGVISVTKRIQEILRPPFHIEGHELHVTTSIGISIYPLDGDDALTLLKNADTALYRSKEAGRDRYHMYSPAMNAKAFDLLILENRLRHAVPRRELVLHYQPIIRLSDGALTGTEALVRWLQPEAGLVLPGVFIELAEETGLILPIGEWVLQTACEQARFWQKYTEDGWRLSVNLSARQFAQENLPGFLSSMLDKIGLPPSNLEVEITETTALQNVEMTAQTLRKLRDMGIQIAIDDFGTGYSSLSHLRRLPIQSLKIDRSFVCNLANADDDQSIVAAVIALAHSLKMRVVAEGVETQAQLDFLRSHNCDEVQGYLLSPPVPAEQLSSMCINPSSLLPTGA